MRALHAADAMTADPPTVAPTMTIWAALARMRQDDIRHLLVVGERGELLGVLSNRDYRRVLERADARGTISRLHEIPVSDVMTPLPRIVSAHPETPLLEVCRLMVDKRIGCVPIVDARDRPLGLVTEHHVMQELARELERP